MPILKKVNVCDCGRQAYGFKKCGVCRSKAYAEKSRERKAAAGVNELDGFFERHIKRIENEKIRCAECGCSIQNPESRNVAHILKKSIFKSVATEDMNILYLCWQHHSDFDSTFERAKKMKVWLLAVERVRGMKVIIKERHKDLWNFLVE